MTAFFIRQLLSWVKPIPAIESHSRWWLPPPIWDIYWLTFALVVIGIVAGIFAWRQITDFRKEARIKHLIDLVDQFEKDPLATYRQTLASDRLIGEELKLLDLQNPPPAMYDVINFFEHMGYLLDGNYIDADGVFVEFHYWIVHIWSDTKELIAAEQAEDPIYYHYFQRMELLIEKSETERLGAFKLPSREDIVDFYLQESHLRPGSPIPRRRRSKSKKLPTGESP